MLRREISDVTSFLPASSVKSEHVQKVGCVDMGGSSYSITKKVNHQVLEEYKINDFNANGLEALALKRGTLESGNVMRLYGYHMTDGSFQYEMNRRTYTFIDDRCTKEFFDSMDHTGSWENGSR